MLMFFFLLSIKYFSPGTDRVEGQFYNPIKVIRRYPAPTGIKDIREKYPNYNVSLDRYPYPGQNQSLTDDEVHQSYDECQEIQRDFGRNEMTLDDQYRHPAGARQFLNADLDHIAEEEKKLLESDRVDIETVLSPHYAHRQMLGVYIPPGELVTIGFSKSTNGEAFINRQAFNQVDRNKKFGARIQILRKEIKLHYPETKIVWPYGGTLALSIPLDRIPEEGLKITVRGCIECPIFRLGIHSDEDWQKMVQLPGPFTYIDTGNLHIYGPTYVTRRYTKVNDALHFFRSTEAFYDWCAPSDDGLLANGRDAGAIDFLSDLYMQYGAAYAYSSLRNVIMPYDWVESLLLFPEKQGVWGTMHELGHNHQANWGCGYTAEVTNNALIVNVYIRQTTISNLRKIDSDGKASLGSGAQWATHPYFTLTAGREEDGSMQMLAFWSILPHYFGTEKFHDYVYSETHRLLFDFDKYGTNPDKEKGKVERCYYRMCMTFKRNMYEHFSRFHLAENLNEQVKSDIDAQDFRVFHPVACPYSCGYYQDDGRLLITARPFRIVAGKEFTFDFEKYKAEEDNTNYFTFERMENVKHPERFRQGSNSSEFIYTPPADLLSIDSFDVVYKDSTDNTETKMNVQVEQDFKGVHRRIWHMSGIPTDAKSALPFYQQVRDKTPDVEDDLPQKNLDIDYRSPLGGYSDGFIAEYSAIWETPLHGNYRFSNTRDGYVMFFISENPITDDDLAMDRASTYTVFWDDYETPVKLEFEKPYYVRFVLMKHQYSGMARVGFVRYEDRPANNWERSRIGVDNLFMSNDYYQLEQQREPFKPTYTFPTMLDRYAKTMDIPSYVDRSKLTYDRSTAPPAQMGDVMNLFDGNRNTLAGSYISQWRGSKFPFPHKLDYNFSDVVPMSSVTLYMPNYNVNPAEQGLNGTIEILCNGTITLYKGHAELYVRNPHEPFRATFDKVYRCQTFNLHVLENSYGETSTCLSQIEFTGDIINTDKIIPTTNQYFSFTKAEDETYGHYFNGKAKHIETGGTIQIKISWVKEIVMLCDRIKDAPIARGIIEINGKYAEQFSTAINLGQDHFTGNDRVYQRCVGHVILSEQMLEADVKITVTEGDIYFNGLLSDGIPYRTELPTNPVTPSESPTPSATGSPSISASPPPSQSPTESATESATASPSKSPTESATEEPIKPPTEEPAPSDSDDKKLDSSDGQ